MYTEGSKRLKFVGLSIKKFFNPNKLNQSTWSLRVARTVKQAKSVDPKIRGEKIE